MLNNVLTTDTICALATPAGGAIGIIRISGPDTFNILSNVFSRSLKEAKGHTMLYGNILDGDTVIDEVLVSIFRSPHSYTGEDAAEISCHGSRFILSAVINLLIKNGARAAKPGEYTQRAFLNGKLDLSQAEAVADLIASTSKASHHMAMSQLKGHFSTSCVTSFCISPPCSNLSSTSPTTKSSTLQTAPNFSPSRMRQMTTSLTLPTASRPDRLSRMACL